MKKSIATLSLALIGAGILFSGNVSAGAQTIDNTVPKSQYATMRQNGINCLTLSEEQQALIKQGYETLTIEEKAFYDTHYRSSKVNLTEDDLATYEAIRTKVHQFLDDATKAALEARHSDRLATREERQATNQANREARQTANQAKRENGTGNQNKNMNRNQNTDCVGE